MRYREIILERIISVGLNPDHAKYTNHYKDQLVSMISKAYAPAGGYSGIPSGTPEEVLAILTDLYNDQHIIKIYTRGSIPTAVTIYKKTTSGRKRIATASNGQPNGKKDVIALLQDDNTEKRAWSEVSGAMEKLTTKLGYPPVPAEKTSELLPGKEIIKIHDDVMHYDRVIGGHVHTKMLAGHPKTSS